MPSSEFFVRHDLTHFAVETLLAFGDAFYGLIAQGWEIDSFGDRDPGSRKARKLPYEAIIAEHLVGVLDLDRAQGPFAAEEILAMVGTQIDWETPTTVARVEEIRSMRNELIRKWNSLEPGCSLELSFDEKNP